MVGTISLSTTRTNTPIQARFRAVLDAGFAHAMKTLVKRLLASGICRPGRGAAEANIEAAQLELGVKFPRRYKDFLRTFGVLKIHDFTVYGLPPAARRRAGSSTVFQTKHRRAWPLTRLPNHYVVLWDECHQDCECLDTSRMDRNECPIVHVSRPNHHSEELVVLDLCDTLEEWLLLKVEDQLKAKQLLDLVMR